MPLDGHSYLVAQGWSGRGSGLREGAISRPLAIPPKKTLSGLGKDRDEAFPFWDHLYTIATKTIKIKIHKDEDDSSGSDLDSPAPPGIPSLTRTSTGILSNRRPIMGTPASSSGSSTPSLAESSLSGSRMNLMVAAKREAAKRGLYSRFFRGPVLGPDYGENEDAISSRTQNQKGGVPSRDGSIFEPRSVVIEQTTGIGGAGGKKENKRRKEKGNAGGERRGETKRKGKGKEAIDGDQDASVECIRGRNSTKSGRDATDNVSGKRKKRGGKAAVGTQECVSKDDLGDDVRTCNKKRRKKDGSADASLRGEGGEECKVKESKEERRRRKEEKRKRKKRKEDRRSKETAS